MTLTDSLLELVEHLDLFETFGFTNTEHFYHDHVDGDLSFYPLAGYSPANSGWVHVGLLDTELEIFEDA
jgi:hypothetical protein